MTDILPRCLRLKDAIRYSGRNRNKFNKNIRPYLRERPDGRNVMFDRLELDAWVDDDMRRHGASQEATWDNPNYPKGSAGESGPTVRTSKTSTSPRHTVDTDLEKAREHMMLRKRKGGSEKGSTPSTKSKSTG